MEAQEQQKRKRTIDDERAILRRYVCATLGGQWLEDITRSTVKKLLRDMVALGINAQTVRTQAFFRQVCPHGIAEFEGDLLTYNPAPVSQPSARSIGERGCSMMSN